MAKSLFNESKEEEFVTWGRHRAEKRMQNMVRTMLLLLPNATDTFLPTLREELLTFCDENLAEGKSKDLRRMASIIEESERAANAIRKALDTVNIESLWEIKKASKKVVSK